MTRLAAYASHPDRSRGRLVAEPESPTRTVHQRDRDRIIHSGAFRRLKYKTQVFVFHEGDHYRTRLTHSLEVAQIARTLSRDLGLNEDLAETVALAHDLGHTPFGHAGEDALETAMKDFGGFDHNEQTLRVVTLLEQRYAAFDGLNLSWETVEGLVKHNGPLEEAIAPTVEALDRQWPLDLGSFAGLEAQVAALADDIAYNNHDVDDGVRAGLFSLDDLVAVPLVGPIVETVRARYPGLAEARLVHETVRRMIDEMVNDLLAETRRRLAAAAPEDADAVRRHGAPMVAFSAEMREKSAGLKAFLFRRMYRHFRVNRMTSKARRVVADLFRLYHTEPECLPTEWREDTDAPGTARSARVVADYIAGMTDRFALNEHRRLFDPYART
jgi:dGTPase